MIMLSKEAGSAKVGQRSRPWRMSSSTVARWSLEHRIEVAEPLAEIDGLRQKCLLAGEGQQLPHEALARWRNS